MIRLVRLLGLVGILIVGGCTTTHPRSAVELTDRTRAMRRILILPPRIDGWYEYYDTNRMHAYNPLGASVGGRLVLGSQKALRNRGYDPHLPTGSLSEAALRATPILEFRKRALAEGHAIVAEDPDYDNRYIPWWRTVDVPPALSRYDAILVLGGEVHLETPDGFEARWFRNLTVNLLIAPFAVGGYLFPLALPFTIGASAFIFDGSSDRCFLNAVLIDAKTERILYQNDLFSEGLHIPRSQIEGFADVLLEEFPER